MFHVLATQHYSSGVIIPYITWAKVLIQRLSAGNGDWDDPNISSNLTEVFPWAPRLHWRTYQQHPMTLQTTVFLHWSGLLWTQHCEGWLLQ